MSIDQLESNVAGVIAQMAGHPTIQCYKVVTVFVDHATGFSFVHFQRTSSAEETVQGKVLFEQCATISLNQQSSNLRAILVQTIYRAHQRQSVSLQVIKSSIQDQVNTKSGPKGFLTPHFPSFLSSFSSHNFGTFNFSKGFQTNQSLLP